MLNKHSLVSLLQITPGMTDHQCNEALPPYPSFEVAKSSIIKTYELVITGPGTTSKLFYIPGVWNRAKSGELGSLPKIIFLYNIPQPPTERLHVDAVYGEALNNWHLDKLAADPDIWDAQTLTALVEEGHVAILQVSEPGAQQPWVGIVNGIGTQTANVDCQLLWKLFGELPPCQELVHMLATMLHTVLQQCRCCCQLSVCCCLYVADQTMRCRHHL